MMYNNFYVQDNAGEKKERKTQYTGKTKTIVQIRTFLFHQNVLWRVQEYQPWLLDEDTPFTEAVS